MPYKETDGQGGAPSNQQPTRPAFVARRLLGSQPRPPNYRRSSRRGLFAHAFTLANGKIVKFHEYFDTATVAAAFHKE